VISLILPYFERQQAALNALALIERHYADLDLEVIVVDDGSPEPFVMPPPGRVDMKLVRLPTKNHAASTCVPWNRGVEEASGNIVVLSCVEMLHEAPVLRAMRHEILRREETYRDDLTYVSAAVWCPEQSRWHVHSSLGKPPLNFLMMMRASLFYKVGGFDEEYREGMAFDDADFSMRLQATGARYVIRDDLVVTHPRTGAKAAYHPEQHERNRKLFNAKWATSHV
jgi:glycosyltransferase involved in cell wall biosynthesis